MTRRNGRRHGAEENCEPEAATVTTGPGEQVAATVEAISRERGRCREVVLLLKPSTRWTVTAAIDRGIPSEVAAAKIRAQTLGKRLRRIGAI